MGICHCQWQQQKPTQAKLETETETETEEQPDPSQIGVVAFCLGLAAAEPIKTDMYLYL